MRSGWPPYSPIEPSLRTLCELCEDQLQVQRTKRLSPVEVAKHATTLERLEPGSLLVGGSAAEDDVRALAESLRPTS